MYALRILPLLAALLLLSGCGKKRVSETKSLQLMDGDIQSYNEGSEDKQFVRVNLTFDKEISVTDEKESLRVTIAGERVKDGEYTLEMGENEKTASLLIPVQAVTSGQLKIQRSEKAKSLSAILDAQGKYAAKDFVLEGIIPSGVSLSTAEFGNGKVVKQVDAAWNIRSIAWVALLQDKTLVPVSETRKGEMLDGYAAVHGHEFLMERGGYCRQDCRNPGK